MKFKHQPFQSDAVNAVADLFVGQEKNKTTFSMENISDFASAKIVITGFCFEDTTTMANANYIMQRMAYR